MATENGLPEIAPPPPSPVSGDDAHPGFDLRAVRSMAEWSLEKLAVTAGVSAPTVRLAEANWEAIGIRMRRKLRPVYLRIALELTQTMSARNAT